MNKDVAIKVAKQYGEIISGFEDDKDVVIEAIKKNYFAIKKASARLRDDKDIALLVANKTYAIKYVSERLRKDYDVALASLTGGNGSAYSYLDNKYKTDPDMMAMAIRNQLIELRLKNREEYDKIVNLLDYSFLNMDDTFADVKTYDKKNSVSLVDTIMSAINRKEIDYKENKKVSLDEERLINLNSSIENDLEEKSNYSRLETKKAKEENDELLKKFKDYKEQEVMEEEQKEEVKEENSFAQLFK